MSSQAQVAANRANAQLSTGPVTAEGKSKVSLNAVKTGLTGRTVLLPGDDAAAYRAMVERTTKRYQPGSPDEQCVVQSIADTEWRLDRIPSLETGIYAIGQVELEPQFAHIEDEGLRQATIQAHIYLKYGRQISNLYTQEGRLRRQKEKLQAELRELQDTRHRAEAAALKAVAEAYLTAAAEQRPFVHPETGFEFSSAQIEERAADLAARTGRRTAPKLAA